MLRIKEISGQELLNRRLRFHPVRIFTYLILLGISSAFLTLVFCYLVTTAGSVWNQFRLPQIFHANTVIILVSSYTVMQMRRANQRDDQAGYKQALLITSLLGLAFTAFQIFGWSELLSSGVGLRNNISGSYLYLISGLHLAHLLAGVGIMFWFLYKAYELEKDAYQSLLFDTDPVTKLKIEMMGLYWHFVDVLWLFLYASFMVAIYLIPSGKGSWFVGLFGN
jgi:cytochrome c oxidase subunit 3